MRPFVIVWINHLDHGEPDEPTLAKGSSGPLLDPDPSEHGSVILVWITPKNAPFILSSLHKRPNPVSP